MTIFPFAAPVQPLNVLYPCFSPKASFLHLLRLVAILETAFKYQIPSAGNGAVPTTGRIIGQRAGSVDARRSEFDRRGARGVEFNASSPLSAGRPAQVR